MSSYATAIGEAVVAVIGGLSSPPAAVHLRKVDSVLTSDRTFPVCVVTEAQDLGKTGQAFGGTVIKAYRIGVSLYRQHGGDVQTGTDIIPSLTQAIQQALHTGTLAGAPSVCDSDLTAFTPFESGGFGKGYEVAGAAVVYQSSEPING